MTSNFFSYSHIKSYRLEFVVTRNVMLSKNDPSNFPGGASINLQDINIMQAQVSV